jgi:hypothetical protein
VHSRNERSLTRFKPSGLLGSYVYELERIRLAVIVCLLTSIFFISFQTKVHRSTYGTSLHSAMHSAYMNLVVVVISAMVTVF